jgi:hypothetical protein
MKNLLIVSLLATLICGCTRNPCSCSREDVCIFIKNETGQQIKRVELLMSGSLRTIEREIQEESAFCLSLKSPGENSFKLEATLKDGKTVTSVENYSEGGYEFNATVLPDKIVIENEW